MDHISINDNHAKNSTKHQDIVLNETKLQNTKINKYLWRRSGTKIPQSTNICAAEQKELTL